MKSYAYANPVRLQKLFRDKFSKKYLGEKTGIDIWHRYCKLFADKLKERGEKIILTGKKHPLSFRNKEIEQDMTFWNTDLRYANFESVSFKENVYFTKCLFSDAFFNKSEFRKKVEFEDSEILECGYFKNIMFLDDVDFKNVKSKRFIDFEGSEFEGGVKFNNCSLFQIYFDNNEFKGNVSLIDVEVEDDFHIDDTKFPGIFSLEKNKFNGDVYIVNALFGGDVGIENNEFKGDFEVSDTKFNGTTDFESNKFEEDVYFSENNKFVENVYFNNTNFKGSVDFENVEFFKDVDFEESDFRGSVDFENVIFNQYAGFREVEFKEPSNFRGSTFKGDFDLRKVKSIKNIHNLDSIVLDEKGNIKIGLINLLSFLKKSNKLKINGL